MTPSVDTRLTAIIGTLEHLVLPALAGADPIVQEQAALALGHLRIIRMQLPHLVTYHLICLNEQLRTGRDLLACAAGGEATQGAVRALESAMAEAQDRFGDGSVARDDRNRVAGAIEQLIIASSLDGTPAFIAASQDLLIDHGFRQSARDRAWYGPTGLDPRAASLPSIEALIAGERGTLQAGKQASC